MDIYTILILLAVLALVTVAFILAQKIAARYAGIERENTNIKNALEKLSAQVDHYEDSLNQTRQAILDRLDQAKGVILESQTDARAFEPQRTPVENPDVVSRVEATLREIVDLAQDMKPLPADTSNGDLSNDARMWTIINGLRSDATETRESLERSQKRLRQLGDCIEDAMSKLRALDRHIKQAKRQERVQALPAPDPDDDDMKL